MTPFGGAEGYKAVFEDPEDPTKSSNVIGEVAAKYILGKTGNLLAWDDFKKVRPDVSKDEYMRYKAFKFDNEADLNPFDDGTSSYLLASLKQLLKVSTVLKFNSWVVVCLSQQQFCLQPSLEQPGESRGRGLHVEASVVALQGALQEHWEDK